MKLTFKHKIKADHNGRCLCGSGLEFKQCHGDVLKQEICNQAAIEKMSHLIREEQKKKIIKEQQKNCLHCRGLGFVEGDGQSYSCTYCQYVSDSVDIAKEYKKLIK